MYFNNFCGFLIHVICSVLSNLCIQIALRAKLLVVVSSKIEFTRGILIHSVSPGLVAGGGGYLQCACLDSYRFLYRCLKDVQSFNSGVCVCMCVIC